MATTRHDDIDAVRRFNRFYTRQIGVLGEDYLVHGLGLTEGRVLFELAHTEEATAADLRHALGLDRGNLSRLLGRLEERGILRRRRSAADARRQQVELTPKGRRLFAQLDERAATGIDEMLRELPEDGRRRLTAAMTDVRHLLGREMEGPASIRAAALTDLPWVLDRHIALYGDEYGWGAHFAGEVAKILGAVAEAHADPRQQGWIAEQDRSRLGAVFCMADDEHIARLRLLIMEPAARGSGLGTRLVETCVGFARQAGYERLVLFTQSVLLPARHIYAKLGFTLDSTHPDESYGAGSVGETWSLSL